MSESRINISCAVCVACAVLTVAMLILPGVSFASQEKALPKPHVTKAGTTYLQSKGSPWVIKMWAPVKGAKIHYTIDGSVPTTQSAVYSRPIFFKTAKASTTMTVKAVLSKDGRTSAVIVRTYSLARAETDGYHGGREIFPPKLCRGEREIKGKVELRPYVNEGKFLPSINVTVKSKGKKPSKYSAGIKGNKWQIKLKRSLKKGDKVIFSVTTKNKEICYVGHGGSMGIYDYSPLWNTTSRKVK